MRFNTAISSMMILATEMDNLGVDKESFKKFLQILSPFAPHVAEELWSILGEKKSINFSEWPKFDESLLQDEEIKIIVQINGKLKAELMIQAGDSEEEVKERGLKNPAVSKYLSGKNVKKVIYVKNRLINIVV